MRLYCNDLCDLIYFIFTVREKLLVDKDSEIAATSLKLSLICPVSFQTTWIFLIFSHSVQDRIGQ